MSTNSQDQEIDLGQLVKKINGLFSKIAENIFRFILFVKKNLILLMILIVLGFVLGYFLDKNQNTYDSEVIVTTNLGGADYLYSKLELLSSKLNQKDDFFFKSINVKNSDKILSLTIEPIVDIYSFVNNSSSTLNAQNTQNFELVKLLAESSDINTVIKNEITSKNYPHHKIKITTDSICSIDETIKPIIKYLNTDEFLNKILVATKENIEVKIIKNEELISQADSLINVLTENLKRNQKSVSLIFNNENSQFKDLFDLKNNLISDNASKKIDLIRTDSIVKDLSIVPNIKNKKGLNGKMKFIIPLLFLFIFFSVKIFNSFYKNQQRKLNQQRK